MFFVLSKVVSFVIYPVPLLFLVLLGVLVFYHRKYARQVLLIAVVGLYMLSIPFTANHLMQWLEVPRLSPDELEQHYDVVIVLSGMINLGLSEGGYIEFTDGVDRILAGISMIKRGIGERLLISGGSGNLFDQSMSEAKLLKEFATEFGLSADQVLAEGTSRNTYENAVNSAEIIRSHNYHSTLLITSAFHIPRALAAFHKQGIFPDIYPVDFSANTKMITPFSFVPSANSLAIVTIAIRELVGLVMYRLQGYI